MKSLSVSRESMSKLTIRKWTEATSSCGRESRQTPTTPRDGLEAPERSAHNEQPVDFLHESLFVQYEL